MNKTLKIIGGTVLAASMMVACNTDQVPKNESMVDETRNDMNEVLDTDRNMNDGNDINTNNDGDISKDDNTLRKEMTEDERDRMDRNNEDR